MLGERRGFEICDMCVYEDDGLDDEKPDQVSGPNRDYTLTEMRENFVKHFSTYRPEDREPFDRAANQPWKAELTSALNRYRHKEVPVKRDQEETEAINTFRADT